MQRQKPRILFVRSAIQATFASFVAGGLGCSSTCEFEQFPPIPDAAWNGIQKTYSQTASLQYLNTNLITDKKELLRKINTRWFDAVLLVDRDGLFFEKKTQRRFHSRLKRLVISKRHHLPLSLAEFNRLLPVAVVDFDDWISLSVSGQHLLHDCSLYCKRELPFNRFFLYYPHRPSPWRTVREQLLPHCAKLRRLPLGIEDQKYQDLKELRQDEQDIDVFFCGQPTSTLRIRAAEELKRLSNSTNWKIVLADSMPFMEFCEHIARSKITVSVSGGGWDCFRHYEAAALGSLPLIDRPTIDTLWQDIADGVCFFESTFGNFKEKMEYFLANREHRKNSLTAIQTCIEQEMLHSKIVEQIIAELLQEKNTTII